MNAARNIMSLIFYIVVCFAVAAIGSLVTFPAVTDWYAGIKKPSWTPPGWLFGPVWTVLYLSMAVAAWLVWQRAGFSGAVLPLSIFAIQLVLNLAWSLIFFGKHNIGLAFVDIVLLWFAIVATIITFGRVNMLASWLLTPYLAWVSFASALNLTIWNLNR